MDDPDDWEGCGETVRGMRDGLSAGITEFRLDLFHGGRPSSQSIRDSWFGLGQFNRTELRIISCESGTRQEFSNLPINRTLTITEGQSNWQERLPVRAR